MNVAFVNENTMGHASYLMPFVRLLQQQPELDVTPHLINATPLPASLSRWANFSVPGVRKWGLDFGNWRWRSSVSRFVRDELKQLQAQHALDAVVVNTQSVGLELCDLDARIPLFVCLDATFQQLSSSGWFAPNLGTRLFLPITARTLRARERQLFQRANRLLAWSESARSSLLKDYNCPPEKAIVLPPSVQLSNRPAIRSTNARPQILFIGADFHRKGGQLMLECYRRWFSDTCDLHLLTHFPVEPEPGVYVHRGVTAYSEPWLERWRQADVFVFPSQMETFGIVLLEALAFEVPVISTDIGAARFVLDSGKAGWLLPDWRPETLAGALRQVLDDPEATRARVLYGKKRLEKLFELTSNTSSLAHWLHDAISKPARDVCRKVESV